MAKREKVEKPPAETGILREILCPQLFAAILSGGLFTFTIVSPVSLPKLNPPGPKQETRVQNPADISTSDALNNEVLFEKINTTPCMQAFNQGQKDKAYTLAMEIAKSKEKRKDIVNVLAAGAVIVENRKPKDLWKGDVMMKKGVEMASRNRFVRLFYARKLVDLGRLDDAVAQYEELMKLSPNDWAEPRLELANLYIMDEKPGKAVDMFNQVLKLKPDDPRIMKRLGIAIVVNGHPKEGFDQFVKGSNLEYDTPNYDPEIQKLVDQKAGLIESAITEVRADVDKNPTDIHKRIQLARLLIAVNRFKMALEQLEEARKKFDSNPEIHQAMAECNYRMKNSQAAQDEFAQTVRFEPLNKPAAPPDLKYPATYEELKEEEDLSKPDAKASADNAK